MSQAIFTRLKNGLSPTRFKELAFEKKGPSLWRVVCTETGKAVGPQYRTKTELLSDLERYARENWGLSLIHAFERECENTAL